MNEYLATIIVAIVTGVFSILTIIFQKRQNKIIDKIDRQTFFMEKGKILKDRLIEKEREKNDISQQIILLILDTNLHILNNTNVNDNIGNYNSTYELSTTLKNKFLEINKAIEEIQSEYNIVMQMDTEYTGSGSNH